jgi:hypothetical protein
VPGESISIRKVSKAVKTAKVACGVRTAGTTKGGRHASAIQAQVNGASKHEITRLLCHKEDNTAFVNYADIFAVPTTRSLGGWPKTGIVAHPRQRLREELRSGMYVPLLYAAFPFIKTLRDHYNNLDADEQIRKTHEAYFIQFMLECGASLIESLAEILILDSNSNGPWSQIEIFNFSPFNPTCSLFHTFVSALKVKYGEIMSAEQVVAGAFKSLDRGEVQEGFSAFANDIIQQMTSMQREHREVVQGFKKVVASLEKHIQELRSQLVAAGGNVLPVPPPPPPPLLVPSMELPLPPSLPEPSTIVSSDCTTWPATCSWVTKFTFQLNPSITTLMDIWDVWNIGWNNFPAVKHLCEKYGRRWKSTLNWTPAVNGHFARVKKIAKMTTMVTREQAMTEQANLYAHNDATTELAQRACQKWSIIRRFLDDVLVKRNASFNANSMTMAQRRKAGEQKKRKFKGGGSTRSGSSSSSSSTEDTAGTAGTKIAASTNSNTHHSTQQVSKKAKTKIHI